EELLKHPSITRVVMAELDAEVVRVAREHLGKVHRGAFDDPRLQVRIGDGWALVETMAKEGNERFDLVVLDLTDPDTPAHRLYTPDFFRLLKRVMNPGAAVMLHIGSPVYKPDLVRRLLADLSTVFAIVRPLGLYVPLYGAYWGMCCASDTLDPLALEPRIAEQRIADRGIADLRYYNGDIHRALFALPNFFRELVPARSADRAAQALAHAVR
ncbi:MAG TPA: polyamine aminopropyltransferase, partial [Burkholderiaceae bacterium]|nr:polyamine aminopropyltransferase [Burkholderiaceae bacterium]